MPDLHWTIPVARWSSWPAAAAAAPDIGFIEPIVRRRLSALTRIALKVAHDCAEGQGDLRVVFASRHGELRRTTEILRSINAGEPVSPTAFSLSVLNAMTGVFGIARGDRSAASAVSAGPETPGYALLEAHAQYAARPSPPVLLVYADETADTAYGTIEDEVQGGALAILLDAGSAQGQLACSVTHALTHTVPHAVARTNQTNPTNHTNGMAADTAPAQAFFPAHRLFPTQSEALLHCLDTREAAAWQGAGATWQWSWHVGAA